MIIQVTDTKNLSNITKGRTCNIDYSHKLYVALYHDPYAYDSE